MTKRKIIAAYKTTIEVYVDLGEFDSWEKAAAAATKHPTPEVKPEDINLRLEKIWWDQNDECRLYQGHDAFHCDRCGRGIADGCGVYNCDGTFHEDRPGWVSTKHGHRIWCSQACRDGDPEDPEGNATLDRKD